MQRNTFKITFALLKPSTQKNQDFNTLIIMDAWPLELLSLIFSHLCGKCVVSCSKVCRRWKEAADYVLSRDQTWKQICSSMGISRDLHDRSNLSWREVYRNYRLWQYSIAQGNVVDITQRTVIKALHCTHQLHVYRDSLIVVYKDHRVCYYKITPKNNLKKEKSMRKCSQDYNENDYIILEHTWKHYLLLLGKANKDDRRNVEIKEFFQTNKNKDLLAEEHRALFFENVYKYCLVGDTCCVLNDQNKIYKCTWDTKKWTCTFLSRYYGTVGINNLILTNHGNIYLFLDNNELYKVGRQSLTKIYMANDEFPNFEFTPLNYIKKEAKNCYCIKQLCDAECENEFKSVLLEIDSGYYFEHGDIVVRCKPSFEPELEIGHKDKIQNFQIMPSVIFKVKLSRPTQRCVPFDLDHDACDFSSNVAVHETKNGHNIYVSYAKLVMMFKIRYKKGVVKKCSRLEISDKKAGEVTPNLASSHSVQSQSVASCSNVSDSRYTTPP